MLRLIALCVACLIGGAGAVLAQFPQRPVRLIVPFPAGGSTDILCRIVGERLGATWGQSVVVENRAGAGGNVGAEAVWRSEPDGHTMLCSPPGPLAINHNLYASLPFDPLKFVPVTILAVIPNVIIARLSLPADSAADFIAYAKANPGKVFYASQGNGSTSHLSAQMLATMAGLEMVHVPYRGEAPAMVDIVAGRIDIFLGNITGAVRFEQAKQVKFLGVAAATRSPIAPHVPSAPEIGLPDFIASSWVALAAPPGTPDAIVGRINETAAAALRLEDVRRRFLELGAEPVGDSPAASQAFIRQDEERWRKVIRTANVRLD